MFNKKVYKLGVMDISKSIIRRSTSPINFYGPNDITERDGIKIIKDNDILHSNGILFMGFGWIGTSNKKELCIYVDDNYKELHQTLKDFLFYHEKGHMKYKHNFDRIEENKRFKRDIKQEYEADYYAGCIMGIPNVIACLIWFKENTNAKKSEIKKRISYLENKMKAVI